MRIVVPQHFRHAGELAVPSHLLDPRAAQFPRENVDVDLRDCAFLRPAAVLWCVVHPLLAHAKIDRVRLLVPTNAGTCIYLKSLGLFRVLQQDGVDVDDRGVPERRDPQVVLTLVNFRTEGDVERLANEALDALQRARLGAGNLHPIVSEIFAELALNAVQHSESRIGAYGFIQFYEFEEGRRFVVGVADGGIGIRRSLERNPELRDRVTYDWDAIELAVRERVSGTGERRRGIGLYGVAEDMRKPGRNLIIHSGIGQLQISEQLETDAHRVPAFPGTLAYASIPT